MVVFDWLNVLEGLFLGSSLLLGRNKMKLKETGSPKLLFANLDLTPVQSILWRGLHRTGAGRPVKYNPEADFKALMLRMLEHIPYIKDLVKRLRREPLHAQRMRLRR